MDGKLQRNRLRRKVAAFISFTLFSSLLTLFVSAPAANAAAPAVPVITSVKFNGTRNVTVGFTQPNNGNAVTSYLYNTLDSTQTLSTSNSDKWQFTSSVTSPLILTNTSANGNSAFVLGTVYYFSLRACNSITSSSNEATENANCSTASAVVTLASGAPSAPTITSVTTGDASISLAFTAGDNGGTALSNYQYTTDGGTSWIALSPASTTSPISITKLSTNGTTSLTNGTSYSVGLKAVNANGTSNPTIYYSATPSGVPGAPTSVTAVAGNTQATVSWTPPTSTGGLTITSYTVTAQEIARTCTSSSVPLATSCTVTGLVNGNSYTFKVTATNATGTGAASTASTAIVVGTPTAPTITNLSPKNGSVDLTFTAGTSYAAGGITNYEYSLDGGTWTARSPSSTSSPMTISGLTNGTSYSIRIRAIDANGSGAASNTVSAAIPSVTTTAPKAPTITSITSGDTSLSVAFTVGSDGGSPITNYQYSTNNGSTWTTRSPSATTSPITISGLTNGTQYTVVIRALNSSADNSGVGATSNSLTGTPSGTPAAPTGVTATNLSGAAYGNSGANLTWTAGSNGGSAIIGYKIEKSTDNSTYTTVIANTGSTATSATVTGLTAGTYYFKVTAINAIGFGTASSASSATALTSRPSAPTITSIAASNATLSVSFSAPSNDGGVTITNYEYSTDDGATWNQRSTFGTASPLSITKLSSDGATNLSNGTSYTVRIRAYNAEGSGDQSASQTATPSSSNTAPGAPTNLVATRGNVSVSLSWSAPASNGGATISGYKVERSTDNSTFTQVVATTGSTSTTYSVTGLTNGTLYYFRVSAINSVGTSSVSNSASATPATTPGAPTSLSATKGLASVALTWVAPTSTGGSAITGYTIEYSTNGTSWTASNTGSTAVSETITGLTNGTAYTFRVSAINDVGTGTASSTATATPNASVPSAPTNLSATAGNQSIIITFTDPASTGGAAITNYKYSTDGTNYRAFSPAVTTSPVTISTLSTDGTTALANGTSYTLYLKATNSAGDSDASNSVTTTTLSGDATLSALTTTAGAISPTFDSAKTSYTATVAYGTSIVTVTPTRNQSGATITVNGSSVTSGSASANISLTTGANSISIVVTAQDGTTTKTYTLTVTRSNPTISYTSTSLSTNFGTPVSSSSATATSGFNPTYSITSISAADSSSTDGITINASTGVVTASAAVLADVFTINTSAVESGVTVNKTITLTVEATIPDPPTLGTSTPDNATVTITWTAPTNKGGTSIDRYVVTAYEGATLVTTCTAYTPATSCEVTGLQNGTDYTFKVVSVNKAEKRSTVFSETTKKPYTYPGNPNNPGVSISGTTATVTISAPSNGGDTITEYTVTYTDTTASPNVTYSTTTNTTSATITGLTNGHAYTFKVKAKNGKGYGSDGTPTSGSVAKSAHSLNLNNAVASTRNFSSSETDIAATSSLGRTVDSYTVTTPSVCEISGTKIIPKKAGTCGYTITSSGTTEISDATISSSFEIESVSPDTPTGESATALNGSVALSWDEVLATDYAKSGGSSISKYVVTVKSGGATVKSVDVTSGNSTTITGLTNETSYTFEIVAVNSGGKSSSAKTISKTPSSGAKKSHNLTITVTTAINYGDETKDIAVSTDATDAGAPTIVIDAASSAICEIVGGKIKPLKAGICSYTATGAESTTYAQTTSSGAITISAVAPGAPNAPSASVSGTTATITFSAPSNKGGEEITEYTISYTDTTTGDTYTSTATSSPATITGLSNGHSYTFKVKASNSKGYGSLSDNSPSVSAVKLSHSLTSVTIPSSRNFSSSTIDISTTSSRSKSVTYSVSTGTICEIVGSAIRMKRAGTCLYSINSSGGIDSEDATPITGSIVVAAVSPSEPDTVNAITIATDSVEVSWETPTFTGGDPDITYDVFDGLTKICDSVTAKKCTHSGLTPGSSHSYTVKAKNSAGNATSAAVSKSLNKASQSLNIGGVSNQEFGSDEQTPTFTASATGSDFTIDVSSALVCEKSGNKIKFIGAGACKINATNPGDSTYDPASATQTITIAESTPETPTSISATATSTSVTLTWSALTTTAQKGGARSVTYRVTSEPSSTGCTVVDNTTCSISGLTEGQDYVFHVVASNSTKNSSRRSSATISIAKSESSTPTPRREPISREATPKAPEPSNPKSDAKNPIVLNPEKIAEPAKKNEKPAVEAVKVDLTETQTKVITTTGGKSENTTLIVNANTATVRGENWNVAIVPASASGKDAVAALSNNAPITNTATRITLERGFSTRTAGSGFKPNSLVSVYIFSDALFLGNISTDENGSFDGQVTIPVEFKTGDHTLQVSGFTTSDQVRSTSIGVTVASLSNSLKFNIYFGMGASWLNASAYKTLRSNIAKLPIDSKSVTVTVTGFVQSTIKQIDTAALAKARARSVVIGLRKLGLKAKYTPKSAEIAADASPSSRRAEVVINWKVSSVQK